MPRRPALAPLAGATLFACAAPAAAHVVAGARVFPVTLTFDDPGVNDEASIPALAYQRSGAAGGAGPAHEVDLGLEFDKTITPRTALIFNDAYAIQQMNGAKTHVGFGNLIVTGKWQITTSAAHEFVASLGIQREVGGTGTIHTGANHYGATTPTLYVGKGLGDLPFQAARPFAITGELGYTIADKGLKTYRGVDPDSGLISTVTNTGANNAWAGGVSMQYSIPYLQSEVRDIGWHGLAGHLIPVVEWTWTSPATSPSARPVTWTAAPGLIYLARWGEIGLEATVPLDRAAGTTVGVVGLMHLFFDDLFPRSLGRPLLP